MKKSLVAAMLCMTLSVGLSTSAYASGQAPPGVHAASSNKIGAGSGDIKQHGGGSGGITSLATSDGKAFALVPLGQGITKLLPVRLLNAGCGDNGGGSSCITPALWRPAVDKVKAPPLVASIFDQNYIGRAHASKTSLGEPPGAAVLI